MESFDHAKSLIRRLMVDMTILLSILMGILQVLSYKVVYSIAFKFFIIFINPPPPRHPQLTRGSEHNYERRKEIEKWHNTYT
jgi:hypothetical protein